MEDEMTIYNVKVKTQDGQVMERKAIDAEALMKYIDTMLMMSNPLFRNFTEQESMMTLKEYQGNVCLQVIGELNIMVKKALGIIKDKPVEPEMSVAEPVRKNPMPPQKPIVKKQPVKAEPVEDVDIDTESGNDQADDEEVITI